MSGVPSREPNAGDATPTARGVTRGAGEPEMAAAAEREATSNAGLAVRFSLALDMLKTGKMTSFEQELLTLNRIYLLSWMSHVFIIGEKG